MVIYKIEHKVSGKIYIGQTVNSLSKRISQHLSSSSCCRKLHNALTKYGIESFDISVIDYADTREKLNLIEEVWISAYNCMSPHGYNLKGGGAKGALSEETRQKISDGHKNPSEETRAKISNSNKGKVLSEETRAKISAAAKDRPFTEEHKAKISAAIKEFWRKRR